MAPINPVALKATISNYLQKVSLGGNKVNIIKETENLLTSTGKKYSCDIDSFVGNLVHRGNGGKSLCVIDDFKEQTLLAFQRKQGDGFSTLIDYEGKLAKPFDERAKEILFDILA